MAAFVERQLRTNSWPTAKLRAGGAAHALRLAGGRPGGGLKSGARQQMAAHESARTTGLYDRRSDEISLDEVEKISI